MNAAAKDSKEGTARAEKEEEQGGGWTRRSVSASMT